VDRRIQSSGQLYDFVDVRIAVDQHASQEGEIEQSTDIGSSFDEVGRPDAT
jgi:hypothetical protein